MAAPAQNPNDILTRYNDVITNMNPPANLNQMLPRVADRTQYELGKQFTSNLAIPDWTPTEWSTETNGETKLRQLMNQYNALTNPRAYLESQIAVQAGYVRTAQAMYQSIYNEQVNQGISASEAKASAAKVAGEFYAARVAAREKTAPIGLDDAAKGYAAHALARQHNPYTANALGFGK